MDLLERIRRFKSLPERDPLKKLDTWLDLAAYRKAEVLSEVPVPFCCPTVAGARAVYPDQTLQWRIPYRVEGNGYSRVRASYCPFCATPLPRLVLKTNPPPQVCETDGYYCEICGSRGDECMCSHPLSIYEVEGAPPVFAVLALVRLSTNGVETYLSVSRKKDPLAKGLPGGKIDPEETFREALVRELLEETGLLAKELHPVFDAVDTSGKRCLTYEVTSYTGALSTQESGVVEWISQEALTAPGPFESYNRALFQHIDPYSRYLDR